MSRFTVHTDGLRRLALAFDRVSVDLGSAAQLRGDFSGRSGSNQVDSSLTGFFRHWSDGMSRLAQDSSDVAACLSDAATAYDDAEDGIARCEGAGGETR